MTSEEIQSLERDVYFKGFNKLKITYGGDKNSIKYIEEIWGINDVDNVIEANLTDKNQLDWLKEELSDIDDNLLNWIGDWTYADREFINERYGFT